LAVSIWKTHRNQLLSGHDQDLSPDIHENGILFAFLWICGNECFQAVTYTAEMTFINMDRSVRLVRQSAVPKEFLR
jgi:hypothetical protein